MLDDDDEAAASCSPVEIASSAENLNRILGAEGVVGVAVVGGFTWTDVVDEGMLSGKSDSEIGPGIGFGVGAGGAACCFEDVDVCLEVDAAAVGLGAVVAVDALADAAATWLELDIGVTDDPGRLEELVGTVLLMGGGM